MKRQLLITLGVICVTVVAMNLYDNRRDKKQASASLAAYTMENWWQAPDPSLFEVARSSLDKYVANETNEHRFAGCTVSVDKVHGVLETSWFRTHKGEVVLKAIVKVWGPYYRVDVWEQAGSGIHKFFFAHAVERQIQEAIEAERNNKKSNQAL